LLQTEHATEAIRVHQRSSQYRPARLEFPGGTAMWFCARRMSKHLGSDEKLLR
jgi:hypothetical protein